MSTPEIFTNLLTNLSTYTTNLTTNVSSALADLSIRDYIRLVWIIGGYLFLRPYLDKGFSKLLNSANKKQDEKDAAAIAASVQDDEAAKKKRKEERRAVRRARVQADKLRGGDGTNIGEEVEEGDSSCDSDEEIEQATGAPSWGKSARRRQKQFFKNLEREAERRKEEDDDKDIEDLLED